mgnify:CR=1 FL=1
MGAVSRRARVVLAGDALVRRVPKGRLRVAARILHSGLWCGLASDELLAQVDLAVYARGRYAYHDTDEHNLRGLFPWERRALAEHFPSTGRLLVTGAGGGREVVALEALGFDVLAYECNPELRARANGLLARRGAQARVGAVARDQCPPYPGDLDAAVVGWGSFTFLRGADRRRRFLRDLAGGLRPGAPALLSFFVRGDARRFRWIARLGNTLGRARRGPPVEPGDVLDPVWQHYVTRDELAGDLAVAGLQLVTFSTDGYGHAVVRRPSLDSGRADLRSARG